MAKTKEDTKPTWKQSLTVRRVDWEGIQAGGKEYEADVHNANLTHVRTSLIQRGQVPTGTGSFVGAKPSEGDPDTVVLSYEVPSIGAGDPDAPPNVHANPRDQALADDPDHPWS
jgi:hypothetical protein